MKQNYIWLSTYCKQFLATFILAFTVSAGFAQTYVNGNLGTSATSNNGAAAAPGTTWHELQHVAGNTTESNSSLASGHVSFGTADNATADDFTVTPGFTWTLSTLRVYSIDQVIPVTGTTSPYNNIRVRIWNGVPGAPGSTVVFGDMTTNRFASTAFSGRKGIFNSLVPTPGAPTPNLPIFSIDATVNTVLAAGTYWIEWQVVHTSNCFTPTSQTLGIRTMPGYNARQRIGAAWAALIDLGNPATAPDVAIDLPFTLTYTACVPVACTGTPAPGNTITSASAVCQNTPFTLSLQNNTPGTGVTYQWQSAPSLGGPYSNIGGGNPTLTVASISATTFYRAIVSCAGNNGTSTPVQVTSNSPAQCGCTSSATSTADEDIFNVSIGGLNNTSTCSTTGTGFGSVLNRYSNYTSGAGAPSAPLLQPGITYPLSVQIGTCGGNYNSGTAVFIDYNQNGLFTDPGERVYGLATQTTGPHFVTGNITIPITATGGITLMRVINVENSAGTVIAPCGTYTWGETEDYLVNIGVLTPCTGTPNPGTTNASSTSVCPGTSFSLSPGNNTLGSGVTYQWQSATVVGGPYTNIPLAFSSIYTTTVSNIFYQVVVTCGGNSGTSTPVFVATAPFSQCYCASTATSTADEEIFNVTVGTLNNSSTCATTAPGPGSVRSLYSNYTSGTGAPAAPNLVQGLNSPFSVQIGTCGGNFGNSVAIFIDLNQNGLFTDAGERVYVSPAAITGPHTQTGNLTIPANATLGITRMRVINVETTAPNSITPCGTYLWGETEDYNVNITPCIPAAITTSPANTSAVCAGSTTFSVSTSGTIAAYQWQYRVNATSPWITVPNAPPYSGVNTATLTISPLDPAMNGYQYRVIVTGACTGADFSAPATLTITPIVTIVTPASAAICLGAIQPISIVNSLGNATLINAGFDAGIPAGWATQNRSVPIGTVPTWVQGNVAAAGYPAFSGAPTSFVYSDYQVAAQTGAANTISNWLFTPSISIKNGDILTFRTRQPGGTDYPDRLEVRASANTASTNVGATATSIGDFTNLLLTINPTLVTGVYPKVWTLYTVTVSGLAAPITGRLAFRVFTPDDGSGNNQNQVGLDDVTYVSTGAGAQGVYTTNAPGTIFTDPLATTPYVAGTLINTVYVKPIATATYTVSYTTASGCISAPTTVTVTVSSAVGGTATLSNTSVCVGSNTFLKLGGTLTGGPSFVHNFQVKVPSATTFSNITAGGVYSISGDTLKLTNVPLSFNGYQFRDSVSTPGNCGSLISTVATLTVNPIPVVTISAAPRVNLFPGLTTTLTATVTGANPPVTYQWFRNGVAVANATNNTLVVGIDGVGSYSVVATGQGCSSTAATTTGSPIVIGDSTCVDRLFIYPSPNSGKFQVRYFFNTSSSTQLPTMVNVYDQKGARVFTRRYVGAAYQAMNVDLGAHGKGIYRVELTADNGDRIKTGSVMVF